VIVRGGMVWNRSTFIPRQPLSDEDPVVIASDEAETQTLSERDAECLRRE